MLGQFNRRAHQYIPDPPGADCLLEWLALMQHFGSPTRLLDFTYSFYAGTFFAVEEATVESAIWAINLTALEQTIAKRLGVNFEGSNRALRNEHNVGLCERAINGKYAEKLVVNVEPFRMNDRLAAQQGLFLFPCDLKSSCMENVLSTFDLNVEDTAREPVEIGKVGDVLSLDFSKVKILKLIFTPEVRWDAMFDLHKMNINAATLFPDLAGFARSMRFWLRLSR